MTIEDIRVLLKNYHPGEEAVDLVQRANLLLMVGISGAGKDTIKRELHKTGLYHDFISYTTRKPRVNEGVMEQNGREYYFIDLETAALMLKKGEFIEANEYSGNIYGTGIKDLETALQSNKTALNDIEVQGVDEYMEISPSTLAVFLLPPSYNEWQRRLSQRYKGSNAASDNISLRIEAAVRELEFALSKDYYHFVVNHDIMQTVNEINDIAMHNDKQGSSATASRELASKLLESIKMH